MTFLPVAVGILNMYIIKKVTIFHNSFGAFWVSRTIGEIGSNIVHVVYSAPVTVFQPKDIYHPPPTNRMLAVCAPLKYDNIFTRKVTRSCILFIWTSVTILMSLYILIPCQMISYSPNQHQKAKPEELTPTVSLLAQNRLWISSTLLRCLFLLRLKWNFRLLHILF
ncbi:hypothetical protein QR680_005114 [Steinernema hermaphroditum]|uniref:7TM GPCR serpentine receptor class x (Srx) domain-containing protein n=1 Tax=Steinernema hermaphroditum TaxID=289476 RepID=A0AA39HQW7_9BILA|nr:hypothetical protein QR680_005114 [Steinernema hermaphroditum]